MPRPSIAVVAPLTGPRAVWGAVLLSRVDQVRSTFPDAAEWHVHDETPGAADAVVRAGCTAIVGHSDADGARRALPLYRAAGLPCLLPFVRAGAPALSWALDDHALARTIVEGAVSLGAEALTVTHDKGAHWAMLAHKVASAATAAGLAQRPGGIPAVLAPQERFGRFVRGPGPVLAPVDCGLASFGALAGQADGREVWAVHPQVCAVRRARTALTALAQALQADPALRGTALTEAVRAHSGAMFAAGGGILGGSWQVSRLGSVCPAREGDWPRGPQGCCASGGTRRDGCPPTTDISLQTRSSTDALLL
ncbi:hypothetical protein K7395_16495 [Streptomyces filamentosus]|uniref:Uncharacterized protein n=2 Tax=Streptomyces filamentosus TaxID=67294 RepID=A0ABY4UWP4_STRFL|nr:MULTISPECIES: hypothetical protein [Streptomyces]EFE76241.1 predicted protein [Streptomyces filamentosus NRRL 15998]EWS93230.1 hypothetical protein SSIG_03805 [Streptomyces filamentosus NRRL 11379]USC48227.1 hypothetical protein K7395_16495 [Streptomyces filamentosus]